MSWATAYIAIRDALSEHVKTAWDCTVYQGTIQGNPDESATPFALVQKMDSATQEENITPTRKNSVYSVAIAGVWARPSGDLEDYAAERAEELRNLIDADNHLGGLCNEARVSGIDWQLPSATDPNGGRLHVLVAVEIEVEYAR
jgi:hypothetical protein